MFSLLGYNKVFPKLPYASQLFGDTAEETLQKAKATTASGYRAVKFGWGPFGKKDFQEDAAHLAAAREGMGADAYVMIDAGTVWGENVLPAQKRLQALKNIEAYWLEEPFINGALHAYSELSRSSPHIPLAGGEGCNNFVSAQAMMDYAGLKFIQIDAGRIGGISVAKRVAALAESKKITYVNHTFTSHLALSASLQSYAAMESSVISEYPVELKLLAQEIGLQKIVPDDDGYIHVPEKAGLGIDINTAALNKYLVEVEIRVGGKLLYYTPEF